MRENIFRTPALGWAIWEFIAKDNPDAASRVVEAAYQTFKKIAASPEMGMRRKF